MTLQARLAPVLAITLLAAGCASAPEGEYPSLMIRDAERVSGGIAVEPYVPPAPSAGTIASAGEAAARARAAHAEFMAALPAARNRVNAARGGGTGSDAWSAAQVAVANLEGARGEALVALADLDALYVETSNDGQAIAPVQDERAEIVALIEQETAAIDGLLAALR